jgi:hypothetical protein
MKSFALACLAASSYAVSLKGSQKGSSSPSPIMLSIPEFAPIGDDVLESLDSVGQFESPLDDLVSQIQKGFGDINAHNDIAESMLIEKAQEEQDSAIEEVMSEANEEAVEVIEEESDASEAAEEVKEIFEDQQDKI